MSHPLFLLLGLFLLLAYPTGMEPLTFLGGRAAPAAAAILPALFAAASFTVLRHARFSPLVPLALRLLAVAAFGALVFVFHWPLWLEEAGLGSSFFLSSLAGIAPLLLMVGSLAVAQARTRPRPGGLSFAFRAFLAFALSPVLVLLAVESAFRDVPALSRAAFLFPSIEGGAALVAVAALTCFLPLALGAVLGARRVLPGPRRDRLEAVCRLAGFRPGALLEIDVPVGGVANAFVAGFGPGGRRVFFTRALLDGMEPAEVDAVLAHEIAHARRRHILVYLALVVGFSGVVTWAGEAATAAGAGTVSMSIFLLGATVAWWGGVFGYVSRRFESEADLDAARTLGVGGTASMTSALERVACLNGMPLQGWSWRHFPIGRRVEILWEAERDPKAGDAFLRVCARLRSMAGLFFLLGLAAAARGAVNDARKGPERQGLLEAYERAERGRALAAAGSAEEGARELTGAIEAGADGAEVWFALAQAARASGREKQAREAEAEARRRGAVDPRVRFQLERP